MSRRSMVLELLRTVVVYAAAALLFSWSRPWLEGQFGRETMQAVATVVMAVILVAFLIAIGPAMLRGLHEIMAEPATGPLRPRRDDPPATPPQVRP